jgi:hypothetical protein
VFERSRKVLWSKEDPKKEPLEEDCEDLVPKEEAIEGLVSKEPRSERFSSHNIFCALALTIFRRKQAHPRVA